MEVVLQANQHPLPPRAVTPVGEEDQLKDTPCPHCNESPCVTCTKFHSMAGKATETAIAKWNRLVKDGKTPLPYYREFSRHIVFDELEHSFQDYVMANEVDNDHSWDGTGGYCYCLERIRETLVSSIHHRKCPHCSQSPCLSYKYGFELFTQLLQMSYDVGGTNSQDLFYLSMEKFWWICKRDGFSKSFRNVPVCVVNTAKLLLLNNSNHHVDQNVHIHTDDELLFRQNA